tara:strand:+ start:127 stop:303 length:177 start_codon:yes stop_codon:yes gene_type:complete
METITVDKKIFQDFSLMLREMQERLEAIELASDPQLMESLRKSKEEIANGEVVDFDEL